MRKSAAGIVVFSCARFVVLITSFFLYVLGTDECGNFRMLVVSCCEAHVVKYDSL